MQRDTIEERAEHHDDEDQQPKPGECANPRRPPAANGGDGEHDRQRFHRLDQRGQERGRHCGSDVSQAPRHEASPRTGIFDPVLLDARLKSSNTSVLVWKEDVLVRMDDRPNSRSIIRMSCLSSTRVAAL